MEGAKDQKVNMVEEK